MHIVKQGFYFEDGQNCFNNKNPNPQFSRKIKALNYSPNFLFQENP